MEFSPRDIRDSVDKGELVPEEAAKLFQTLHEVAPRARVVGYAVGTHDDWDFIERVEYEEAWRHRVAKPIYAIVGVLDAITDSAAMLAGEITEDITFMITRVGKRAKDGVRRGLK